MRCRGERVGFKNKQQKGDVSKHAQAKLNQPLFEAANKVARKEQKKNTKPRLGMVNKYGTEKKFESQSLSPAESFI